MNGVIFRMRGMGPLVKMSFVKLGDSLGLGYWTKVLRQPCGQTMREHQFFVKDWINSSIRL